MCHEETCRDVLSQEDLMMEPKECSSLNTDHKLEQQWHPWSAWFLLVSKVISFPVLVFYFLYIHSPAAVAWLATKDSWCLLFQFYFNFSHCQCCRWIFIQSHQCCCFYPRLTQSSVFGSPPPESLVGRSGGSLQFSSRKNHIPHVNADCIVPASIPSLCSLASWRMGRSTCSTQSSGWSQRLIGCLRSRTRRREASHPDLSCDDVNLNSSMVIISRM